MKIKQFKIENITSISKYNPHKTIDDNIGFLVIDFLKRWVLMMETKRKGLIN